MIISSIADPSSPGVGGTPLGASVEPPRMSPFARYVNVLFSPGPVFEDIRRNPTGWWLPIVVGSILFALMASIHVAKYDQAAIAEDQVKSNAFLKLAPPAVQEKAVEDAVNRARNTPAWHQQLQFLAWTPFGYTVSILFFTFLYGIMALMMGWLPDLRASTLFINLGIFIGIGVLVGIITAVAYGIGARDATHPPPSWTAVATSGLALVATAALWFFVSRSHRKNPTYGRLFTAITYGTAPGAVAFLVGLLIIVLRVPDATPVGEIIPSSLGALMDPKTSAKWLVSLGSSLDLFSLWSMALTIIGLSKVMSRKTGEAAAIVLIPWAAWVLCKTAFAAVLG